MTPHTILRNGEMFDLVWAGDLVTGCDVKGGLLDEGGYQQSPYAKLETSDEPVKVATLEPRGAKVKPTWRPPKQPRSPKLPVDAPWHGTACGYRDHFCACGPCRSYQRAKSAAHRDRVKALRMAQDARRATPAALHAQEGDRSPAPVAVPISCAHGASVARSRS